MSGFFVSDAPPICFGTAFTSDFMSQLDSRERGGALDTKNPDPYYCARYRDKVVKVQEPLPNHFIKQQQEVDSYCHFTLVYLFGITRLT